MSKEVAELMTRLTAQMAESAKLEGEIKKNLAGLGYQFPVEARNVG